MLAPPPAPVVERTSQTAGVVAHHPAVVVSSRWLSDMRCGAGSPASLGARLTLPSGVSLARGSVASVDVPVRPGLRTARWRVHAVRPGMRTGRIVWTATGADGTVCRTVIKLRLVVAASSPQLAVTGAARFRDGVAVVLRAVLPGVRTRPAGAFGAFFLDHPERVGLLLSPGRGIGDLFFAQGRGQLTGQGIGFDARGVGCVRVSDPSRLASLPYRIRFTWNHELGLRSIRRRGAVSVSPSPVTPDERGCVSSLLALTRVVEGG